MSADKLAIYIHYPYCLKKCPYCDFNSFSSNNKLSDEEYLKALKLEISYLKEYSNYNEISSLFFGGGTPSLMSENLLGDIIDFIDKKFIGLSSSEISLEANPSSVEVQYLKQYHNLGVNRLSIGVQSFNDKNLQFLGRVHNSAEAIKAIEFASQIFDNFSFDLIYSLPNQSIKEWQGELKKALSYKPNHISLYQLTIEPGTIFENYYNKGDFTLPDDDTSFKLYEYTHEYMQKKGYEHYEISNFAKAGFQGRHNLGYWQYNNYLGAGPGAHSRLSGIAFQAYKSPKKWYKSIIENNHAIEVKLKLSNREIFHEAVLMALRCIEGLDLNKLTDLSSITLDREKIEALKGEGLIMFDTEAQKIIPTFKGMCLYNYLITKLA